MAASKRHIKFPSTVFTQTSPSATVHTITGVRNVSWKRNGQVVKHLGDADAGPSVVAASQEDPTVSITMRDLNKASALTIGARGSLAVQHGDAIGAMTTGNGGYTMTLNPAVLQDVSGGGPSHDLGEGSLEFCGEFSDGVTNPMTFAAA
jgi:hypothetical protein